MSKKSLLALMLAAVMVLSGCSLVLKDQEVDNLLTIIDVNGTLVNKQVFTNTYEYNLTNEQNNAAMFGISVDPNQVLDDTINTIVTSLVTSQKSTELDLDQMSEEDEAQILVDAQASYDEMIAFFRDYYFAGSELTGEELDKAVAEQAVAFGITLESMAESERNELISDRLRATATDAVTVTDDELQAELDRLIAEDKASFESTPALYGSSVINGTDVYYTPAGYRTVNIIELDKPTEEGAEDTAKAEIEALAARAAAGEAFDTLSEDITSMPVCSASTNVDAAVVEAAMLLVAAGDVSPVVETQTGYALVQYVEEIAEKAATLEEKHDTLHADLLADAQEEAYNAAVEAWIAEANVKIYYENINN